MTAVVVRRPVPRQVDAVILDTIFVVSEAASSAGTFDVVGQFKAGEHYGAIVSNGSRNLPAFNAVVDALQADGTLERLSTQFLVPHAGGGLAIPYITMG